MDVSHGNNQQETNIFFNLKQHLLNRIDLMLTFKGPVDKRFNLALTAGYHIFR